MVQCPPCNLLKYKEKVKKTKEAPKFREFCDYDNVTKACNNATEKPSLKTNMKQMTDWVIRRSWLTIGYKKG
jgi:hypothetical protein